MKKLFISIRSKVSADEAKAPLDGAITGAASSMPTTLSSSSKQETLAPPRRQDAFSNKEIRKAVGVQKVSSVSGGTVSHASTVGSATEEGSAPLEDLQRSRVTILKVLLKQKIKIS